MTPFQYDLKNKELNVNFNLDVIDNKQTPILSGKHCQALDLGQQVHKIDVNFKELLDQHPGVQNTSRAMPGTSWIENWPHSNTSGTWSSQTTRCMFELRKVLNFCLNPFIPTISSVILLTICHKFLWC